MLSISVLPLMNFKYMLSICLVKDGPLRKKPPKDRRRPIGLGVRVRRVGISICYLIYVKYDV